MTKTALITGCTGQDGSYLAEFLLDKGYEVHGIVRRSSSFNTERIDHIFDRLNLHFGDLTDAGSLSKIVNNIKPDEIYHLGAQSHVRVSFDNPVYTADTIAMGTLRLLEAVKEHSPKSRMYNAATSEMFGAAPPPQDEDTPFKPQSVYGASKVAAFHYCKNYREAYGLYICSGVLFNHESPRRGETFVTRKITRAATRIKLGLQNKLSMGNLAAKRDWGHAKDYVRVQWLMLQQDEPDDYVISTGHQYSVQEFLERVFKKLDLNWKDHYELNPKYFRPTEVDSLLGNCHKAKEKLGWELEYSIDDLIDEMIDVDMKLAKHEKLTKDINDGHIG